MALSLIGVRPETKKKLDGLKMHHRETYDDLIDRKLHELEIYEREPWEWMGDDKDGKPMYRRKLDITKKKV